MVPTQCSAAVPFFNISVGYFERVPHGFSCSCLRKTENELHKALYFLNVKNSTWKLLVMRLCNSKKIIKPPNKYTCELELKLSSLNILAMHGISIQFHTGI